MTFDEVGVRRLSVRSPKTGNTISVPMHRLPVSVFEKAERGVARVARFTQFDMPVGRVDLDLSVEELRAAYDGAREAGREEAAEAR